MSFQAPAYLGLHLVQLLSTVESQADELLKEHGFEAPSRICSVLIALEDSGPCAIADVARKLRISHQLVSHRINVLLKLGWAKTCANPDDARKVDIRLTRKGKEGAKRLSEISKRAGQAYMALFEEIGIDYAAATLRTHAALLDRPLNLRIRDVQDSKHTRARRAAR